MDDNFKNILADGGEVLLDGLLKNEVLKEIPILGTSLNLIRGVFSVRDRAYMNKIKTFVENLGEMNEEKIKRLVEESKQDEKRRVKFGDAMFTTIEQSDSLVKVEYLALCFEAFLNKDFEESDLRLLCHVIRNSFTDDLVHIAEHEKDGYGALQYMVASGLAEAEHLEVRMGGSSEPRYHRSGSAHQLRNAWLKYSLKKEPS